jgi:alpha-beta hydrolase superfamily lysophospholipase
MLHGGFAHSGWYMNLPDHEAPRGYSVYAYDQRGWGRSPGQRGYVSSGSENLEDLGAFLSLVRAEEPDRPLFLMGHTGSGPIVLEYALRHPQGLNGVFCVSPTLDTSAVAPPPLRLLLRILSRVWPRFTLDVKRQFAKRAAYVSHDPAFVKLILEDPLRSTKITARYWVEMENSMQRVNAEAAGFPVPLLILIGSADSTTMPTATRAFYQRVASSDKELHEYAGAYTNLLSDTVTPEVLKDIDGWLSKHA